MILLASLFALQLSARSVWFMRSIFRGIVVLGGGLGLAGVAAPLVEVGITLSIIVLGLVVAFNTRSPVAAAMGLLGIFALFHGRADGTEMPGGLSSVIYALGFIAGVILLHALGEAFARAIVSIDDGHGPIATRTDCGFTAFSGLGVGAGVL
ncbi:HupE/UreJ family protein [Rhizobium chutanense]|uniref:Urease accessory protein n=1 Tax=Rhizobium chutanense TaxID=2035448 RepID=A0A3S0STM8_9HYPH|nr:HupE/UreJ family protein [Rhizobium chutanense]RUM03872.1 urease accessory protein [Rhizobium chutanense]